jgi:hypothetical protein
VAALDGIEVLSSFSRRCENCLQRRVTRKEDGRTVEHIQYSTAPSKPSSPWNGSSRERARRPRRCDCFAACRRFMEAAFSTFLLLDALYAQTPVLNLLRDIGWDAVISLKQNSRDLYQSAVRLFAQRPSDVTLTERRDHKTCQIQLWDTEGLPFTIDNPDPVRVVRSEEVLERQRYRRGGRTAHSTDHECLWITTLPQSEFPATVVRQLGHSRWKNENNGWMDLTKHWALKHGFLHACQHRPKQVDASSGQRESVANHGLAAVVGFS